MILQVIDNALKLPYESDEPVSTFRNSAVNRRSIARVILPPRLFLGRRLTTGAERRAPAEA